ncbi:MAG: SurA N-terminal domain-containing protein [Synergistaceae bacterium]|nr:SurA N-terminal domain-containing protein [Synergistaceae bacterium]
MLDFLRRQMKWVMAIIVVAFLLSTFFMYEGRSTRRSPSVNADGTMTDYEVAQINGRSLMRSELETRLRNYLSNLSSRNLTSLDMPAMYQTVLNQAVLESQLVKEIDEQGIKISDAQAEQAMKVYADTYYPTRETFYQVLANSGIKVEDYKRNLARQIAVDQLMTKAIGEINISEDKAHEFYDSMKDLFFTQPEGFMVHMADFRTSADAEAFRTRIIAGESWDVIASEDKFESSDVVNITKAPVFLPASALRTGTMSTLASLDISKPSEVFSVSSSDFAVGMKTSSVDKTTRPYAEVSGDIKNLLTQEEQRKRLADYEESLRTKAQVVINDESLFARPEVSEDKEEITPEIQIEAGAPLAEVKEEPESQDNSPVVEVKEEAKVEEPAKSADVNEDVKAEKVEAKEEVAKEKAEEKTESPKESEDVKVEAPVVEEVKEAAVSEDKTEVKAEAEKVVEVVEEAKEEIKAEVSPVSVDAAVEKAIESLDSKVEIPTETK